MCALHCAQLLHRTDLIIFPVTLQTITTALMMSIWGKGGFQQQQLLCVMNGKYWVDSAAKLSLDEQFSESSTSKPTLRHQQRWCLRSQWSLLNTVSSLVIAVCFQVRSTNRLVFKLVISALITSAENYASKLAITPINNPLKTSRLWIILNCTIRQYQIEKFYK